MKHAEHIYGIGGISNHIFLPLLRSSARTLYEGSIDKTGGNADWDWWLYQDEKGEWVIFDHEGPGCIYNFVQHRYPTSEEPTFRFYFDGEIEPRFTIKHSQFGEVYPFIEPLASRYIGPVENGRGPIRVVRSFVPMPYARSCKITSDIKLEGYDKALGHGGWGHVIYQSYPDGGISTFSGNDYYYNLIRNWKNAGTGSPLIYSGFGSKTFTRAFSLGEGESVTIFEANEQKLVSEIKIRTERFAQSHLSDLYIRASWDGHKKPDVYAPLGCFFSNELGYNSLQLLYSGMNTDGEYYNFFPMPFNNSAKIEIVKCGKSTIAFSEASVFSTAEYNDFYKNNPFGYFRSSDYYDRRHTEGADSVIAKVSGCGHIVSSTITAYAKTPETCASCEGDVRVHIDGRRTPSIESDGSESYSCYGWGFPTPPESNPISGYDGYFHLNWSMTRQLPGECYPFASEFSFAIESGGDNDYYLEHSGMVFYYGVDKPKMSLVNEISFPEGESLESFFEGDDDHISVSAHGEYNKECEFTVNIPENTDYLIIRRMSDQKEGRQRASVYVCGERTDFDWYYADRNPIKRWLEDEYVITEKHFNGKDSIAVKIVPESDSWNSFGYKIFAITK